MSYYGLYCSARSNYQNACGQVWSCQRNLESLAIQKQATIDEINQLKIDIQNHEEALSQIKGLLGREPELASNVAKCEEKIEDCGTNYTAMAECDTIATKNVHTVYHTELNKNSSSKKQIVGHTEEKKQTVNNKLSTLRNQLVVAQNRYNEICSAITSTQRSLENWEYSRDRYEDRMWYYYDTWLDEDD